ncbi:MAG: electron transfer flavoprotein-ubiquinone oxidoreductase [Sphingopyxis sp.]
MSERESMPYDVVIVGAGPAGLAAAIRLKQRAVETGADISVCVLEKGSEVGAHILSGAVIDPKALDELLPDWRTQGCPLAETPVSENLHWVLTKTGKFNVPHVLTPPFLNNKGTYTASLGAVCRWLGEQAEALGVEIFPGFAAAEILYGDDGAVMGVATGDMGVTRSGEHGPDYAQGLELHARYTLFAEGARGHLTKGLKAKYALDADAEPQVYGLGIKELWDIPKEQYHQGRVIHTQGWPISDADGFGGGFLYHQAGGQVALGYVTWLGYSNPHLSPFQEMQQWKTHPAIAEILKGGKRISYGARAICDGGFQSLPKLTFPGGALIGCTAGFLNVPRIKGSHTAMKSGMMAADAAADAIAAGRAHDELIAYTAAYQASWVYKELRMVRNFEPIISKFGGMIGTLIAGAMLWLEYLGIRMPFTLGHTADHAKMRRADAAHVIDYPKADGVVSFDRLSSVFLSNTNHEEDQPCHLHLADPAIPISYNLPLYDEPAQRYCPAGVYEVVGVDEGNPRFQINAQNCVHCKTCDIKDMTQNINWVAPQGGGGPNYPNM